jgi:hypothetical protein
MFSSLVLGIEMSSFADHEYVSILRGDFYPCGAVGHSWETGFRNRNLYIERHLCYSLGKISYETILQIAY